MPLRPSSTKLHLHITLRLLTIPLHPMILHPPMTRVVHPIQVEAVTVVVAVVVTDVMTIDDPRYRDQAVYGLHHPGIHITSFYTPHGIQKLDTLFSNRIRSFGDGKPFIQHSYSYSECRWNLPPKKEVENIWNDDYPTLKKDIEENPHLHADIKANLLFNLENYRKLPTATKRRMTEKARKALYTELSAALDAEYELIRKNPPKLAA